MEVSPIKKLNFEVYKVEFEDDASEKHFSKARIHAFSSGKNRHNMICDVETLKSTAPSIYEKPILFEVKKKMYGDEDFGGHTDEPKIAGFVVPDSAEFKKLDDGRIGLIVLAKIWKHYAPDFMEIVSKKGESNRRVSVEMELLESKKEPNGWTRMINFVYAGIAVLGKTVVEASPGANMQMVSFSSMDDKEAFFEKYAKYGNIDFSIPKTVSSNAKNGLELKEKYGRGGTAISIVMGEFLSSKNSITPEKILHMREHFSSLKVENKDKTSDSWINYQLWGGTAGKRWCNKISKMMKDEDKREKQLFEEGEGMPYKKKSDFNPALKGIKPPISVSQANKIAKQADAIGDEEDKNGWAISIANFKKTHKVENGKWISKKKAMSADNLNIESEELLEGKEDTVNMENKNKDSDDVSEEELTESEDKNMKDSDENKGDKEPVTMEENDSSEGNPDNGDSEEEDMSGEDTEDSEEFSLPTSEIRNRMGKAVYEASKGAGEMAYYVDHCGTYAYVFCDESGKYFRMPYKVNGDNYVVTYTKDEEVYRGWTLLAEFTAKESEIQDLREFKKAVEQERFEFNVEKALSDNAMNVLSKSQKEEFRSKAEGMKNNLTAWENELKAFAFDVAKQNGGFGESKTDNADTKVFGLPFKQTKVRSKNSPFG